MYVNLYVWYEEMFGKKPRCLGQLPEKKRNILRELHVGKAQFNS